MGDLKSFVSHHLDEIRFAVLDISNLIGAKEHLIYRAMEDWEGFQMEALHAVGDWLFAKCLVTPTIGGIPSGMPVISCIKHVRNTTGLSLLKSQQLVKDFLEAYYKE